MQTTPLLKAEDKLWAAIAHGSVLIPFWGSIAAVIIWFTQRKRSAFVRFHSLQAVSFQVLTFWAFTWIWPLVLVLMIALSIGLIALIGPDAIDGETLGMWLAFGLQVMIWAPILAGFALFVLLGLFGAGFSLGGREFRYPLFGKALSRKLGYSTADSQIIDEQEDRVAAGLGHGTAILLIVGAFLPLALWITQRERSRFLEFQSLQAAVYQGFGALAYFLGIGLYFVSVAAFFAFGFAGALEPTAEPSGIAFGLMIVPMLCFFLAMMIGGPLYHLFAAIAGVQVLRGRDYNYPLLGKFIRRRMTAAQAAPSEGNS